MSKPLFSAGEVVISKQGKHPFRLTYDVRTLGSITVWGVYLHNGKTAKISGSYNLIRYEEYEQETAMENTKTLYTFKDADGTDVFGTAIGQDSSGNLVIEVKGARGGVVLMPPSELTEVLPYTFCVTLDGKDIHYVGEPGKVQKGDLLLLTGSTTLKVATVKAVDTKNKTARAKFSGVKIVTEAI